MINGYVARDDSAQQIIVAVRGTHGIYNIIADALAILSGDGVIPDCPDCRVHSGFLLASQAVEPLIQQAVDDQLAMYPGYKFLVTGHSLGGAVASLLVHPIWIALKVEYIIC